MTLENPAQKHSNRLDPATASKFLTQFFEHTQYEIELRAIKFGGNVEGRIFGRDIAEIEEFLERNAGLELYFGVTTREGRRGKKENCREAAALWVDLDFKDVLEPEARKRIAAFGLSPSIVIASGGGLHCYWLLREPAPAYDIEKILKGLTGALGADRACAEIARVLRVPGTINHKYDPPREVRVVEAHWERCYPLDQFVQFELTVPASATSETPIGLPIPIGISLRQVFESKLKFEIHERDGKTYYEYHGLSGINGQPQACLIQGTIHTDQKSNSRQSAFVEKAGRFWHTCFDSDCRDKKNAAGMRGAENLELGDTESKTRMALRRLDELIYGPSLYDQLCETMKFVDGLAALERIDMPKSVLDGRLGDICQKRLIGPAPVAYAWPALIATAGTLANQNSNQRTNTFVALVGRADSGKSATIERAVAILGLDKPALERSMSGSAEGLFKKIGNAGGCARLYAPDELAHFFSKAAIENASFQYVLQRAFYETEFELVIAKGKVVPVNVVLGVLGGIVEEKFGECFDASTTGGMYDRFIFGLCPLPFMFDYRPFEGNPEAIPEVIPVTVDPEVWKVKTEWLKIPGMTGRVAENALRVASICAGFDGRAVLRAKDLEPALEFAKYQIRVRAILQPNPGLNFDATCAIAIKGKLAELAPGEEWISKRDVSKLIHSERYGPGIFRRAGEGLIFNSEIERTLIGKTKKKEFWRLAK